MKNKTKLVIAAVSVLFACGAQAQNAVIGVGANDDSCLKWLAAREYKDAAKQAIYVSWVQGNLSARLEDAIASRPPGSMGKLGLPEHKDLVIAMDAACKKVPSMPLFVASTTIWFDLLKKAGLTLSPTGK